MTREHVTKAVALWGKQANQLSTALELSNQFSCKFCLIGLVVLCRIALELFRRGEHHLGSTRTPRWMAVLSDETHRTYP